ncbi:MAG: preprotein translocase subunit SecA [Bacilli bacterium]
MSFLDKVFRTDERAFKKIEKKAKRVFQYEDAFSKLSDSDLKSMTVILRKRLADGETIDEVLPEAFATAREAGRRVLGQFPYPVQVFGATVLNEGDVAEMKTGEGKTLTATMAVYLNALEGKGTHVVTVNEYLASRDAAWMGNVYRFLGLSVGVNLREKSTKEKQDAYNCDITYSTNSELGFDYLRDNMAKTVGNRVLRGLHFCVIDEADSILVDESRTPLIISGGSGITANSYVTADRAVKMLRLGKKDEITQETTGDYYIDLEKKTATLTDRGVKKIEKFFSIDNLFDAQWADLAHRIQQALKGNYIMKKDVEYMVSAENQIELIDGFTGRVMKGREYSDGLQQALQAKEHVEIKPETVTLATITYQNFFRLYDKIAGMTGTAKTEEDEFRKVYNMRVIPIPTNRPIARVDDQDLIFGSEDAKYNALALDIERRHILGQPILVGTPSVEKSEIVDKKLNEMGIRHEVLNAKNNAKEATIIAEAGQMSAVTIATNMAGRGTDIKLGKGVKEIDPEKIDDTTLNALVKTATPDEKVELDKIEKGEDKAKVRKEEIKLLVPDGIRGLAVIATERNESRRIDNQLKGRSGRQGDPGYSRFYVSMGDELFIRFAAKSYKNIYEKLGDYAIQSKMMSKAITSAQKRIEGMNFDTRKQLLNYDDVLSRQRKIMYERRDHILYSTSVADTIPGYFDLASKKLCHESLVTKDQETVVDVKKLQDAVSRQFVIDPQIVKPSVFTDASYEDASTLLSALLQKVYAKNSKPWPEKWKDFVEKTVTLDCVDRRWTKHIDKMAKLRDAIWLRSYAQTDPLQAYANEGFQMFNDMLNNISYDVVHQLLHVQINLDAAKKEDEKEVAEKKAKVEHDEAVKKTNALAEEAKKVSVVTNVKPDEDGIDRSNPTAKIS